MSSVPASRSGRRPLQGARDGSGSAGRAETAVAHWRAPIGCGAPPWCARPYSRAGLQMVGPLATAPWHPGLRRVAFVPRGLSAAESTQSTGRRIPLDCPPRSSAPSCLCPLRTLCPSDILPLLPPRPPAMLARL
ncbi:hypothetical protein SVAN01_07386 [Stagonosporopsis vannaccii]|nr:hypothetical protein SVAN01_07386 [Stagonosporopsis vannaccii]